jgi:hypothetical protein
MGASARGGEGCDAVFALQAVDLGLKLLGPALPLALEVDQAKAAGIATLWISGAG